MPITEERILECSTCHVLKTESEFGKSRGSGKQQRLRKCLVCLRQADSLKQAAFKARDPERYKAIHQAADKKRPDRWRDDPGYRERNKGYAAKYRENNRQILSERGKARRLLIRRTVIDKYGGQCACCGESSIEFLAVDHIGGWGKEERKVLSTWSIYLKLYNSPERLQGYQILCHNCNFSIGIYGYCPHHFTIADPSDPGSLDVVGFDASVPQVVASFVTGGRPTSATTVEEEEAE